MNLKHFIVAFFVLSLFGCDKLPVAQDPPILSNVPTMAQIADSLNRVSALSSKWAMVGDSIVYSKPYAIDWEKEFQSFLKDDVNKQRFADAYTITDSTASGIRSIAFSAVQETQEIRSVKIVIDKGRVTHYSIHKERSNLLSSSSQFFRFDESSYELNIRQSIRWFFDNEQFVHGNILPEGKLWHGVFHHDLKQIPIQFVITPTNDLIVKNDNEFLTFHATEPNGDSITYESAYFSSCFIFSQLNDSTLEGRWINKKRDVAQSIKIIASSHVPYRFKPAHKPHVDVSGNHKFNFINEQGALEENNILKLEQNNFLLTGSLLTETGDYRFLEGVIKNDSIYLSTMDGTHLMYFEGFVQKDKISGKFLAGSSYTQQWVAELNTEVKLSSPESITHLNPNQKFDFAFPDETGSIISRSDDQFKNKVLLVSIMGTWCSNCLDESLFLKELHEEYSQEKLSIVALDFELVSDSIRAIENIKKYKKNMNIEFPILLAATHSSKEVAAAALPSLNGIFSYPTLVVLNKNHEVIKIHTGFSGPATGEENYVAFTNSYRKLINELIYE